MKVARIQITKELLKQALHMPEDTKILNVFTDMQVFDGNPWFVVSHPDLEYVREGSIIPEITPNIITHISDGGRVSFEWMWYE